MDKLSVSTVSVLLLSLSFCFLPSAGAASGAALLEYECNNGTSYAANSTYQSNVRSLLATLAANASRSSFPPVGFATAVVGASPNTVWGLGLCRGDTNGTDCASCLALAPEIAFGQGDYCMGVKEVSIFYDRCLVHYSFRDFLSRPDNRLVEARDGSPDNVTRDAGRFDALVVSLVGALSDWAAFNTTTRYAVGTMVSDQGFTTASKDVVRRITGLVQCTPDQAPGPCRQCLQALVDEMPAAFDGSVGGHILRVWCNLRFEVFEFYDDSPMLQLVAPPPAPPPSSSPPESRGQTDLATVDSGFDPRWTLVDPHGTPGPSRLTWAIKTHLDLVVTWARDRLQPSPAAIALHLLSRDGGEPWRLHVDEGRDGYPRIEATADDRRLHLVIVLRRRRAASIEEESSRPTATYSHA